MSVQKLTAIIAGGGPVGLTMALGLARANIDFIVLERRDKVVVAEGSDMTILPMTMRAVDQMNLREALSALWSPITEVSRIDHGGRGMGSFHVPGVTWGSTGYYPSFLSRENLLKTLLATLPEQTHSRIYTGKAISDIRESEDGVTVSCKDGTSYSGTFVIGADGAHSVVRQRMRDLALEAGSPNVNEANPFVTTYQALWVRFPTSKLAGRSIQAGAASETHGFGVATQLFVGGDTATVGVYKKLPAQKRNSARYNEKDEAAVIEEIGDLPMLKAEGGKPDFCLRDVYEARLGAGLVDLEEGVLPHWSWGGRVVLVGDAAHKFTPSMGSGLNFGMLDSVVLANRLHALSKEARGDGQRWWDRASLARAFEEYQKERYEVVREGCQASSGHTAMSTWANLGLRLFDQYLMPSPLFQWFLGKRMVFKARSMGFVGFEF
ncbi:FAD binding domain-containing protein [Colletotrichum plurivorum]|uniref:FAD binding domain-containing protein n=1 Tax=Colletotrichum plurivorum TaxID=2175906 RepID=A0A8H6N759_9PEZI|nr:FAD binding domain-containing protein [Colletotrichum plurivorum]